jgi:hypothetical protein
MDVDKDTLTIQGPQDTDSPGILPSPGWPDLAVIDEPTSEMIKDKRKPDDNIALDAQIYTTFRLREILDDLKSSVVEVALPLLLMEISKQIDHEITLVDAVNMVHQQHPWLQDLLIAEWRKRSFTKVRRLSECPLCIFHVNTFT